MKALVWHGKNDVRIDNVPDPKIQDDNDIIIKVTSTAICGSDLHILDGMVPTMESGDILGHEFMGEVVEIGKNVRKFKNGDKIVVPFTISCGHCEYCNDTLYSLCDWGIPFLGYLATPICWAGSVADRQNMYAFPMQMLGR